MNRNLFPNTFIMLVSPPGIGKTDAIGTTEDIWRSFANLSVAPQSMTGKGIVDELASEKSRHSVKLDGESYEFSSLLIPAPELGTLIQEYDVTQISILNELFDCRQFYQERTRGGGFLNVDKPHINLILGTQPKFIGHIFPETAFGMGLTSRMLLIYDDTVIYRDLFDIDNPGQDDFAKLRDAFRPMAQMKGQFHVTEDAKDLLREQLKAGIPPKPDNLKLAHYNTRRPVHLLKICMCIGAARHNRPEIHPVDVNNAIELLHDAEALMPNVFTDMHADSDGDIMHEAFDFVFKKFNENDRKPIKEAWLVSFLSTRVPSWKIDYIVSAMNKAGMIVRAGTGELGNSIKPGRLA